MKVARGCHKYSRLSSVKAVPFFKVSQSSLLYPEQEESSSVFPPVMKKPFLTPPTLLVTADAYFFFLSSVCFSFPSPLLIPSSLS